MREATASARSIDPEAVARAVALVATVWFAFTAFWGICSVPGAGHIDAGSACNAMTGEQMIRWKILYPAFSWYTSTPPPKADYLCTHPYAQEWIPAFLLWVFGHRDFVVHLPAALMSTALPPLLYGIARARWGAVAGAVAAASYVVVPIAVGFSNFWNLEIICIFGALLFFWGHSRHLETGKHRHLTASLVGLLFACSGDWVGYLIVAPTLAWAFLRAFILPARLTPQLRFVPYARWWATAVAIVAGTLALWIGLFHHIDKIGAWLAQGEMRAGGGDLKSLSQVLAARKAWIDFSFTPLAILLGKIAAPFCLILLLFTRRDEETYPLALLFGAVFQYVAFRQGADVHIFWPHYFAPYFALSLAWLVGMATEIVRWLGRRSPSFRRSAILGWTSLGLGLLPALAMTPDGVKSLWVWRRTGGKYDESQKRSNVDLLVAMRQVILPKTPRGTKVDAHASADWGWEHVWTLQADANPAGIPAAASASASTHPFWIGRGSGLGSEEEKKIAAAAHLRIYGDVWIVDQREAAAPLDAYSMNEREPNPFAWFFSNGTEPVRSIGSKPDPWLTWEWRTHLGQSASPPTEQPQDLDQMRIAHNVALELGDVASAAKWRDQIEAKLDRSVQARFDTGANLVGLRKIDGVEPRLELWFECTSPMKEVYFDVIAAVEARARLSLIPPHPGSRRMAFPPSLPTALWKQGYLYRTEVLLNHLIGRERYAGYWASRNGSRVPSRVDGQQYTTLAILP